MEEEDADENLEFDMILQEGEVILQEEKVNLQEKEVTIGQELIPETAACLNLIMVCTKCF